MTHGHHIYQTASELAMTRICSYPQSQHSSPHWKFVLCCCSKYPCIDISIKESDQHNLKICFHVYILVPLCMVHVRCTPEGGGICWLYLSVPALETNLKLYTRKEFVMTETSIYDYHTSFYIPDFFSMLITCPHAVWYITSEYKKGWIFVDFVWSFHSLSLINQFLTFTQVSTFQYLFSCL